jgi:hypothetical protein
VALTDSRRRHDSRIAGIEAEREEHAERRVADLQRVVAMLLAKNEELRQQLMTSGQLQL